MKECFPLFDELCESLFSTGCITIGTAIAPLLLPKYGDNPNNWIWPSISNGTMPLGSAIVILFSDLFMVLQDWQFYFSRDVSHGFVVIPGLSGGTDLFAYSYIPQAWTIGTEIGFYLLAPLIIRNMRAIMIAAIASLLLNWYWVHIGAGFTPWRFMFLPSVMYLFMLGAATYHVFLGGWVWRLTRTDIGLAAISLFVFILVARKIHADQSNYIAFEPRDFTPYLIAIPLLFMITKSWKIDRFIGELSYPLYICHLLVFHVAKALGLSTAVGGVGDGRLVMLSSVVLSIVLAVAVDMPINTWRHRVMGQWMKKKNDSKPAAEASTIGIAAEINKEAV